jgi:polyisoprenyl-phosphate glycosyltransferase
MKTVTVITPCYNEESNIAEVYNRVRTVMAGIGRYRYEHIFIDNSSRDRTVQILRTIAARDKNVRLIVNARNFGHIRSPMHALYQAKGDAVIGIVADLQDPPELIPEMLEKWEQGFAMVLCIKAASEENPLMYWIRKKYYRLVNRLSSLETFENFTGFGLFDQRVVEIVKSLNDPYPYFRGIIAEIGLPHTEIFYTQPRRKRGLTKNNFYSLYDTAMLGVTNLSKVPLRLVTFTGFVSGVISLFSGLAYLLYKLLFWSHFEVGIAPLVMGLFFFGSVQLVSMGILGEYIGAIYTQVSKRPYVIEKERINFEFPPGLAAAEESGASVVDRVTGTPRTGNSLPQLLETLTEGHYQETILNPASAFDRIAANASKIIVFGCGYLGELALRGLRASHWEPAAFIDNNRSLHGSSFHGVPILSPEEGIRRFNHNAVFVVAIYNGSSPRAQLAALGCTRIVPYPMLFWRFSELMEEETRLDLPHRILSADDQLHETYALLCDQKSRDEFAAQIFWRSSLDYSRLPPHDPPSTMYFPRDLVRFTKHEVFMDCGAFDGDSIRLFLEQTAQRYRRIIALEPDPQNREALRRFADGPATSIHDLAILSFAVSDHTGVDCFDANGSVGSALSADAGGVRIECRRVDDIAHLEAPTFIKMDIEGAEPDALEGARSTIRQARPILAVCAYHKCEHLWKIPLLMHDIVPDYKIHLRRYAEECWETVYYAIPPERAIAEGSPGPSYVSAQPQPRSQAKNPYFTAFSRQNT